MAATACLLETTDGASLSGFASYNLNSLFGCTLGGAPERSTLSVGRDHSSQAIVLSGDRIFNRLASRAHALLHLGNTPEGRELLLEDLNSSNGTFVNDRRLEPSVGTKLHEGDIISFGGQQRMSLDTQPELGIQKNPLQFRVTAIAALRGGSDMTPSPSHTDTEATSQPQPTRQTPSEAAPPVAAAAPATGDAQPPLAATGNHEETEQRDATGLRPQADLGRARVISEPAQARRQEAVQQSRSSNTARQTIRESAQHAPAADVASPAQNQPQQHSPPPPAHTDSQMAAISAQHAPDQEGSNVCSPGRRLLPASMQVPAVRPRAPSTMAEAAVPGQHQSPRCLFAVTADRRPLPDDVWPQVSPVERQQHAPDLQLPPLSHRNDGRPSLAERPASQPLPNIQSPAASSQQPAAAAAPTAMASAAAAAARGQQGTAVLQGQGASLAPNEQDNAALAHRLSAGTLRLLAPTSSQDERRSAAGRRQPPSGTAEAGRLHTQPVVQPAADAPATSSSMEAQGLGELYHRLGLPDGPDGEAVASPYSQGYQAAQQLLQPLAQFVQEGRSSQLQMASVLAAFRDPDPRAQPSSLDSVNAIDLGDDSPEPQARPVSHSAPPPLPSPQQGAAVPDGSAVVDLTAMDSDDDDVAIVGHHRQLPQMHRRRPREGTGTSNTLPAQRLVQVARTAVKQDAAAAAAAAAAVVAPGKLHKAEEDLLECTICRDIMVAAHAMVPCGHMFCGSCLGDWLPKNPTCPTCRTKLEAPPVRTWVVDDLLELRMGALSPDDAAERVRRKDEWDRCAAEVAQRWKALFPPPRQAQREIGRMPVMAGLAGIGNIEALISGLPGGMATYHDMMGSVSGDQLVDFQLEQDRRAEHRRGGRELRQRPSRPRPAPRRGGFAGAQLLAPLSPAGGANRHRVPPPQPPPRLPPPGPPMQAEAGYAQQHDPRRLCSGCNRRIGPGQCQLRQIWPTNPSAAWQLPVWHRDCVPHEIWGRLSSMPAGQGMLAPDDQAHVRRMCTMYRA